MLRWHLAEFPNPEWVFSSRRGGFLRYDNFRTRVWGPAVERASLSPLTFHQLRHTAAALMIDEGGDSLQIKRRMGPEDIRTTLNVYGHLFPDREDDLLEALDRRRNSAIRAKDAGSVLTSGRNEWSDPESDIPADEGIREWTRGDSNS